MSTAGGRAERPRRRLAAAGEAERRTPRRASEARFARRIAGASGAGAAWAAFASVGRASAAAWASGRASQAGVGTLPLLAAMGIGVAVAVLAVIAFLQMTKKARQPDEEADREPSLDEAASSDAEEEAPGAAASPFLPARPADPERTIPLPAARGPAAGAAPARQGMPSVWGVAGEFSGSGFLVSERWLTMGRDASQCHIVFRNAAGEISRKHCSLRFEESRGLFLLEDHASSNGTFLSGGERLQPGVIYELPPGERFALSGSKHWFEVQL